ncbi:uncharacterized protein G2W53_007952 [Senna tora]|uniref:Uncharacterized protein n=1 Tax=Senna tora TaxID=362788 RepID=A0A834X7L3_9FABA|nr:uncharacterized protein G2W53_007952 [Senna tora]
MDGPSANAPSWVLYVGSAQAHTVRKKSSKKSKVVESK